MTKGYYITKDKTNAVSCDEVEFAASMVGDWARVTKEEYDAFVESKTSKTIKKTIHLYSDRGTMYSYGQDVELSEKALENFSYALYDVTFDVEIERATGLYKILEIRDNKHVFKPVVES